MAFPGALPSFTGFTSSHTLAADNHAAQHNLEQSEIVAVATKMGTGASTPSTSTVLRSNSNGTSTWGQVVLTTDVSGTLPIASGGTGQSNLSGLTLPSAILANPSISGTVGGSATYSSPTLTTPTIASFINATHNHQNNAGGGQLDGGQAIQEDTVDYTRLSGTNWPRVRVAEASTQALGNGAGATEAMVWDSAPVNTGSMWSAGAPTRLTAPVDGLYYVYGGITWTSNATGRRAVLFAINGVEQTPHYPTLVQANTSGNMGLMAERILELSAGDYVEIKSYQDSGADLNSQSGRSGAGMFLVVPL